MLRKIFILYIIGIASLALTACDFTDEKKAKTELMKLGQCKYVGEIAHANPRLYEAIDQKLMAESVKMQHQSIIKKYPISQDYRLHVARDMAGMEVDQINTDARKVSKIFDWYRSDYCQEILKIYQDDKYGVLINTTESKAAKDINIYRTFSYVVSLLGNDSEGTNDCQSFKIAENIYRENPTIRTYKSDMEKYFSPSIKIAVDNIPEYKRDFIYHILDGSNTNAKNDLIQAVSKNCQMYVSESVATLPFLNSIDSTRTINFIKQREILEKETLECGEMQGLYCQQKLKIKAINDIIKQSKECDKLDGSLACEYFNDGGVKALLKFTSDHEIILINYYIAQLAPAVENPESRQANADHAISLLMSPCMIEGSKFGYTGPPSRDYKNLYCRPKARWEYMESKRSELNRLIERKISLQSHSEPPKKYYGFSSDFAKVAPSVFMWACNSNVVENQLDDNIEKRLDSYKVANEICKNQLKEIIDLIPID